MKPIEVIIAEPHHEALFSHLYPGDNDEHGAVLLCGFHETRQKRRLLVREVLFAKEGVDYVPGTRGYRQLQPTFIARALDRSAENKLIYLAVHNHGAGNSVSFSKTDTNSHRRSYPSLIKINEGRAVGALVFATMACAGRIWTESKVEELSTYKIIGLNQHLLRPSSPKPVISAIDQPLYDRQTRVFGVDGQRLLGETKIAVIGAGGVGSILVDLLAHKGIRHIVSIDPDKLEYSNLPRFAGFSKLDRLRCSIAKRLAWLAPYKVKVLQKNARKINPSCKVIPISNSVEDPVALREILECDFVFLAADSHIAKLQFNKVCQQYLIPGIQLGVKIETKNGKVGSMTGRCRFVLPGPKQGCLNCNNLIDWTKLTEERQDPSFRKQYQYIESEPAAAIMEYNTLVAAQGVSMMSAHILGTSKPKAPYLITDLKNLETSPAGCLLNQDCPHCGNTHSKQIYATGR